jgi:hypothetical protein
MLDMRSAGGSDSVGKADQGNRVSADGLADPFSEWVDAAGKVKGETGQAGQYGEGGDRLRAAMASVGLLTELDEIDRDDVPPLASPHAAPGGTGGGTTVGSLEEILVAELGSEFSRGIAIPPAANDRGPVAAHAMPGMTPTFFAQAKSHPDNSAGKASAPPMPGRRKAEAAIDRQLLLNRIVRARDAIIAEEQEAAKTAAPAEPTPSGADEAPEYDTEIEERPGGITRLFTLRRMALAATALALVAGAAVTAAGTGGFALPRASTTAFGLAMPDAGTQAPEVKAPQANVPQAKQPAASVSAADLGLAALPAGDAPKAQAAAVDAPGAEPIADRAEKAPPRSATENAGLAERIGGVEPLALVPQQGASPAEEAIRQRLLAGGGNRAPEPALAGSGGASLASAGTLVVNDGSDGRSARAGAELAPAALPGVQGSAAAGLVPRDPSAVEAAMAATLGLSDLDASQREELKNQLVAGECPSAVLARMFGRAPVVAARDLVRNLENGC